MDIKKIEELVESSELTDEAKDLIYELLPRADEPGVKEEILRTIRFEIEMNQAVANEAETIIGVIEDGDKMIEAVDDVYSEQMENLGKKTEEKFAELDKEKDEIDKEMGEPSSDEGPAEEVVIEEVTAPEAPAEVVPPWNQPAEPVIPPAAPAPEAPAEVVPQWNQPAEPVIPPAAPAPEAPVVAPWNQTVTETTTSSTQPATFPGNPTE